MSFKKQKPPDLPWQGQVRSEFSKSDTQRMRDPITRSRGLVRGQFPSTKTGRMIAWESQLEERACYLFEFTKAITSFREQPIRISFPFEGNVRSYTGDFEVTLCDGQVCHIEIKPLEKLLDEKNIDRWRSIATAFKQCRNPWYVLTEEDLPTDTNLRNLKLLRSHLRHALPVDIVSQVTNPIFLREPKTLQMLIESVGSPAIALALIAQRKIHVNLDLPLSTVTALLSNKEYLYETRLFSCRTGPDFKRCELSNRENSGKQYVPLRAG